MRFISGSLFFNEWKRVRIIENEIRQNKNSKLTQNLLKLLRFFCHIFVALMVFASGIVSKGSILYITTQFGKSTIYVNEKDNTQENWLWTVVLVLCTQYSIEFFLCIFNLIFRQNSRPSFLQFIVVSIKYKLK